MNIISGLLGNPQVQLTLWLISWLTFVIVVAARVVATGNGTAASNEWVVYLFLFIFVIGTMWLFIRAAVHRHFNG